MKFILFCDNGFSNCGIKNEFEVDEKELKGIPEDKWGDHVWNKLGGKEEIFDQLDMGCFKAYEK